MRPGFRLPDEWVGWAQVLAAMILFSTVEVAAKRVGTQAPWWLTVARFLLAGVLLLPGAVRMIRLRSRPLERRDAARLIGMGLVGVTIAVGCFQVALVYLPANVTAILFSANPLLVAALAPLVLRERFAMRQAMALVFGLVGSAFFVFSRSAGSGFSSVGLTWLMLATAAFSLYTVLARKWMPLYGAMVLTCGAFLSGGLFCVVVAWMFEGPPWVACRPWNLGALLYLAVAATALAYVLYFKGVLNVGAARGSLFFFLKPALASFAAWVVLGERLDAPMLFGGGLIVLGLIVATWPGRRPRAAEHAPISVLDGCAPPD